MKQAIKRVLIKAVPIRLKNLLFRASFSIMSGAQKDAVCFQSEIASMEASLRQLRVLGFQPRTIVDVGAFQGVWTQTVKKIFPAARVLMVEAQVAKSPILDQVAARYSGEVDYEIALLGPRYQEDVAFYELETGSSVLPEQSRINRKVGHYIMRPLDEVTAERVGGKVDFLKLDVQGFELEILKGGTNTLREADVVLLEVALLGINKGAPLIDEVLVFMKQYGFVTYDICSFIRRPLDNALWQSDFLFVKEDSAFRQQQTFD